MEKFDTLEFLDTSSIWERINLVCREATVLLKKNIQKYFFSLTLIQYLKQTNTQIRQKRVNKGWGREKKSIKMCFGGFFFLFFYKINVDNRGGGYRLKTWSKD